MKEDRLAIWLLLSLLLFACIGAFAHIMTSFDHNEHMYITAGVLVAQGQDLYRDFAYLQTPYLPFLYAGIYRVLGISSFYLLTGKLISFSFLMISAMTLFLVTRRVLDDVVAGLSVVLLFLLNRTILNVATEVSNYILPLSLSLLSFYVFTVSIESHIKPLGIAFVGFCLAIAAGVKLTYAPIAIPFIAAALVILFKRSNGITVRCWVLCICLPLVAGAAIGLFPLLFFLSDFDLFLFNNLGYHLTNTQRLLNAGFTERMSLYSKLVYAHHLFFRADNLPIVLAILLGLGFFDKNNRTTDETVCKTQVGLWLALLLVIVAIPTSFVPTPSYAQYFAMPESFFFILLVYSAGLMPEKPWRLYRRLLLTLVVVSVAYDGQVLARDISRLPDRDAWVALHVHAISMNLRSLLPDRFSSTHGKIGTLSPLFAVEANLPVYSQLTTGPFLYSVGDLLTRGQRDRMVGTSPNTIANLFAKDPPTAIIVGFEGELDKPLRDFALCNNYSQVHVPGLRGILYVRR